MLCYIESPCCLAYARTGSEDDKVSLLESAEDAVYIPETCFDSLDLSALFLKFLDFLDVLEDDIIDVFVLGFLGFLRNLENSLLGAVEDILRRQLV